MLKHTIFLLGKILPFQFIAAAKNNPTLESMIEKMLFKNLSEGKKLLGKTILLIDISGSMDGTISEKSEMTRLDSACGIAILLREIASDILIFTFSNEVASIPDRHGFALRDSIFNSQFHGGTELGKAIITVEQYQHDRLIVITDEQSYDAVKQPKNNGYMINVASDKNGVGYGKWNHVDGFSSSIIEWIIEYENLSMNT